MRFLLLSRMFGNLCYLGLELTRYAYIDLVLFSGNLELIFLLLKLSFFLFLLFVCFLFLR